MFKRVIASLVIVCFSTTFIQPLAGAQSVNLPAPGTMVNLSPAYEPALIKGLTVHKDNPFLFDFIVDVGQDKLSGEPLKKEGEKLIKYFLASLAIPDKDLWVNLSPYEKNKMIPEALGQTDMGRDLLAQDYILKQITASLIYPGKQLGKTFWDKVYAKAQAMYGTTEVPAVGTFNKVWITADRAEVFERNQTAFVVDSHLKVLLEADYLALQKATASKSSPRTQSEGLPQNRSFVVPPKGGTPQDDAQHIGTEIVRQVVLPELEKEVNQGKNFANLRQIFNSIILSSWYKKNLQQALLNQVYANQSKVKGIDLNDPTIKEQIYQQYLKAYKKGVFNYIKEDINAAGTTVPRKYFSGGLDPGMAVNPVMTNDPAMLAVLNGKEFVDMAAEMNTNRIPAKPLPNSDKVMTADDLLRKIERDGLQSILTPRSYALDPVFTVGLLRAQLARGSKVIEVQLQQGQIKATMTQGQKASRKWGERNFYIVRAAGSRSPSRRLQLDGLIISIDKSVIEADFVRYLKANDLENFSRWLHQLGLTIVKRLVFTPLEESDNLFYTSDGRPLDYYRQKKVQWTGHGGKDSILQIQALPSQLLPVEVFQPARYLIGRVMMFPDAAMSATPLKRGDPLRPRSEASEILPIGQRPIGGAAEKQELNARWQAALEELGNGQFLPNEVKELLPEQALQEFHPKGTFKDFVDLLLNNDSYSSWLSRYELVVTWARNQYDKRVKLQNGRIQIGPGAQPDLVAHYKKLKEMAEVLKKLAEDTLAFSSRAAANAPDAAMTAKVQLPVIRIIPSGSVYKELGRGKTTVQIFQEGTQKLFLRQYEKGYTMDLWEATELGGLSLAEVQVSKQRAQRIFDNLKFQLPFPLQTIGLTSDRKREEAEPFFLKRVLEADAATRADPQAALAKQAPTVPSGQAPTVPSGQAPGGIDLATSGMQWKVSQDPSTGSGQAAGVEMNVDPAMIERVRREGIDSLTPVIFKITPVTASALIDLVR